MRIRSWGLWREKDRSATPGMVGRSADEDVIGGCISPLLSVTASENRSYGVPHRTGESSLPYACIFSRVKEKFCLAPEFARTSAVALWLPLQPYLAQHVKHPF
jgi:hypothetical protein